MQSPAKTTWRNRITHTGEKPAREFVFNPENWRGHPQAQRDALNEILTQVGWVQGVIVNAASGFILDGHARVEEALELDPETLVPFVEVDLSVEEERLILLLLDPIGAMAQTNAEAFLNLSESLEIESAPLLDLIASMNGENLELSDEPNLNDPNFNYENQFGVIVECDDESHQKKVFDELQSLGHKVKVVVV